MLPPATDLVKENWQQTQEIIRLKAELDTARQKLAAVHEFRQRARYEMVAGHMRYVWSTCAVADLDCALKENVT